MRLSDIEKFEEKLNELQEYDIIGHSNRAIIPSDGGEYYCIRDIKDMIDTMKHEGE